MPDMPLPVHPESAPTDALSESRDARGRFRPGVSGNPAGKRPGTRHAKTILEEAITGEEGHKAARVVIEAAVEGDKVSARWLINRIDGKPRGRFIEFAVDDNGDMTAGLDAAFRGVMDGTVTLAEAWDLMRWVRAYREMVPAERWMDRTWRDPADGAADGAVVMAAVDAAPDAAEPAGMAAMTDPADIPAARAAVPRPGEAGPDGEVRSGATRSGTKPSGASQPGAGRPDAAGSPAKHLHSAGGAGEAPGGRPPLNRAMRRRAAAMARAAA